MIRIMKYYDSELPIYDFLCADGEDIHKVDTNAYLDIFDSLLESMDKNKGEDKKLNKF